MHPSIGPCLGLVLILADELAQVGALAVREVWERWIGPQRFQRKLRQLTQSGLLEPSPRQDIGRVVQLTSNGRLVALGGRDPESCWTRQWDGRWRVIVFDVPEIDREQRERLRRRLRAVGFGYLQNSVWVTPDTAETVRNVAQTANVDVNTLSFLDAQPCAGETDPQIVHGAWDFDRINHGYKLYCELLKGRPGRLAGFSTRRSWLHAEWRAWCITVGADPLLPQPLLPASYRGQAAWHLRRETLRQLLKL